VMCLPWWMWAFLHDDALDLCVMDGGASAYGHAVCYGCVLFDEPVVVWF